MGVTGSDESGKKDLTNQGPVSEKPVEFGRPLSGRSIVGM